MQEWRPHNVEDVLARWASATPDALAVKANGSQRTYAELAADVRRTAAALAGAGLRKGDHFAICMGNCIEWAELFLAAASIGAVTVPINTRYKPDELAFCLGHADIKMLAVTDRLLNIDFIAMLRDICPEIDGRLPSRNLPKLETIVVFGGDVPTGCIAAAELTSAAVRLPANVSPDDVLLIQFTSGTTANPKGVVLTHEGMLRDGWEAGRRLGLEPGDRYYSPRPLFHVAGTTMSLLASLEAGACYITSTTFKVEEALERLESEACTHTSGNDTMFLMMMNHPTFPERRFALRAAWAAATPAVMQQIHDRMGIGGICAAYGMSECSGNIAISPADEQLEVRIAGYAEPLPDVEIRIVNTETGAECPAGMTGEIWVRGWNVMRGYYKQPEETDQVIDQDKWLHTGDLGVCDEQGRLAFVGRLKDTIRVGGENVSPADVENVLHEHPAVKQAQVVGVPDARLGEVVAAYLVLNENAEVDSDEITRWAAQRCANFKVPRYVRFVETFDGIGMTASAKVQKRKLREYAIKELGLNS